MNDDELAGDLTVSISDSVNLSDDYPRDLNVALVEQTLSPGVKYAAWMPVTQELLDDMPAFGSFLDPASTVWDRSLRPWRLPDRNPMPTLDLVPASVRRLQATVVKYRSRLRNAWTALRHDYEPPDDEDDW